MCIIHHSWVYVMKNGTFALDEVIPLGFQPLLLLFNFFQCMYLSIDFLLRIFGLWSIYLSTYLSIWYNRSFKVNLFTYFMCLIQTKDCRSPKHTSLLISTNEAHYLITSQIKRTYKHPKSFSLACIQSLVLSSPKVTITWL